MPVNPEHNSPGQVPHSSGRNKYATKRTAIVFGTVIAVLLFIVVVVGLGRGAA